MKITCPQCGYSREVAAEKIPAGSVVARCPKCGCRFRFSSKDGSGAILPASDWYSSGETSEEDIRAMANQAYEAEARRYANEEKTAKIREDLAAEREKSRNPWDDAPNPDGWIAAFYQTLIRVMFQAPAFFRNISPFAPMPRPFGFFIAICVFQSVVERFWGQVIHSFLSSAARDDPGLEKLLSLLTPDANILLFLALRCGALLLQLYLFSLLMYLAYKVVARDKATFSLVFQIIAYSSAPWILCIIPFIGSLAGTLWGICCIALGAKAALNLDWPKTLAGFLPLFILVMPVIMQVFALLGQ